MTGLKKVTIGSLGNIITGSTPSKKSKDNYGNYALWIKPTDINENEKYTRSTEEMFSEKYAEQCKSRMKLRFRLSLHSPFAIFVLTF